VNVNAVKLFNHSLYSSTSCCIKAKFHYAIQVADLVWSATWSQTC